MKEGGGAVIVWGFHAEITGPFPREQWHKDNKRRIIGNNRLCKSCLAINKESDDQMTWPPLSLHLNLNEMVWDETCTRGGKAVVKAKGRHPEEMFLMIWIEYYCIKQVNETVQQSVSSANDPSPQGELALSVLLKDTPGARRDVPLPRQTPCSVQLDFHVHHSPHPESAVVLLIQQCFPHKGECGLVHGLRSTARIHSIVPHQLFTASVVSIIHHNRPKPSDASSSSSVAPCRKLTWLGWHIHSTRFTQ